MWKIYKSWTKVGELKDEQLNSLLRSENVVENKPDFLKDGLCRQTMKLDKKDSTEIIKEVLRRKKLSKPDMLHN